MIQALQEYPRLPVYRHLRHPDSGSGAAGDYPAYPGSGSRSSECIAVARIDCRVGHNQSVYAIDFGYASLSFCFHDTEPGFLNDVGLSQARPVAADSVLRQTENR